MRRGGVGCMSGMYEWTSQEIDDLPSKKTEVSSIACSWGEFTFVRYPHEEWRCLTPPREEEEGLFKANTLMEMEDKEELKAPSIKAQGLTKDFPPNKCHGPHDGPSCS